MVYRAVSDSRILHAFDDFENRGNVLFRLAVELDIGDVPAASYGVERRLQLYLLAGGERLFYVDVEAVDVVVAVVDPAYDAVPAPVHLGEPPRKPLRGGC